jgi:hypothetical protein
LSDCWLLLRLLHRGVDLPAAGAPRHKERWPACTRPCLHPGCRQCRQAWGRAPHARTKGGTRRPLNERCFDRRRQGAGGGAGCHTGRNAGAPLPWAQGRREATVRRRVSTHSVVPARWRGGTCVIDHRPPKSRVTPREGACRPEGRRRGRTEPRGEGGTTARQGWGTPRGERGVTPGPG